MPTPKSQTAKEKRGAKKENPIVKFVRRAVFFVLIVACAALYWQNTNLTATNRSLTDRLSVASKRLAKHRETLPDESSLPRTPVEAAQLHLTRAKDALDRNDYATAIAESERAGADISKVTQDASAQTRSTTKELTTSLAEIKQKIADLTGHSSPPPPYQETKPVHKAVKGVT